MSAKRASTRNVVLSKAMKHVDEETRREFREKRLQSLESDNYVEGEIAQADEDAYNDSEVGNQSREFILWNDSDLQSPLPISSSLKDEGGAQKRKRAKGNGKSNNNAKSK